MIAGPNAEETIEAAVDSLLRQDWPNLQVIVFDLPRFRHDDAYLPLSVRAHAPRW